MALLRIAEPGQSPVPHQQKSAIGIDLGTTYSLVAVPGPHGPIVLPDENQRPLLPSVVQYLPGRTLVGYEALEGRLTDPRNTIVSVKRFMGRGLADVAHVETMPYDFVDSDGMVRLQTNQGAKTPVEVSAEILKKLYQRAQLHLRSDIVGAVITVPAYFDDAQRQATKDAARLAGLHVLRLLNEPTAAAVAYGLDNSIEGLYAVFDLGGGTFDISILRLTRGVFEVLATGGDTSLGGDDFDQRLYCHLLDTLKLPPLDAQDSACLLMEARRIKEQLTTHQSVDFQIPFIARPRSNGTIDRETFSTITRTLVDKTLTTVRQTLRSVRLTPADIQGVVMVGGASRMPHVQQAVSALFGRAPINNLDPDQVVALGAARQAGLLVGQKEGGQSWTLLDVVPLSLGVETMGGLVEKIVPRHATLPVARSQEFTTAQDGQAAMSIHIVQGERELVNDCRSLGQFTLTGLPPLPAGAAKIKVVFQVDADSLLSVTAQEQTTGVQAGVQVKPSYGLSEDQIKNMLQDSLLHSQQDLQLRQQREERVEAERLLYAVRGALQKDVALLEKAEQETIENSVIRLEKMLVAQSPHIKEAREDLERVTHDFAVRRMNHSVQSIMSGRRLEEFT